MNLIRQNVKFVWTDKCKEAFQELKRKLSKALVLSLPDDIGEFDVYSDASRQGLGYVLM